MHFVFTNLKHCFFSDTYTHPNLSLKIQPPLQDTQSPWDTAEGIWCQLGGALLDCYHTKSVPGERELIKMMRTWAKPEYSMWLHSHPEFIKAK